MRDPTAGSLTPKLIPFRSLLQSPFARPLQRDLRFHQEGYLEFSGTRSDHRKLEAEVLSFTT